METLEKMIERHEGKRLKLYHCPAGHLTIGIGHNVEVKPLPRHIAEYLKEWGEITDEMAMELLREDILAAEAGCKLLFPDFAAFTLARHNACVDFVLNV